jgi:predicted GH43/DUF377 family glycosyl hydrolase
MKIKRSEIQINADFNKVIALYLNLGIPRLSKRISALIYRVLELDESEVTRLYASIEKEFGQRHPKFEFYLRAHYDQIKAAIPKNAVLTETRKMLMGAYFTKEYSIQAAALFNPSMVAHPDQSGLATGEKRFIISLRAVGEGHISSIEFRSGVVNVSGDITLEKDTGFASVAMRDDAKIFNKKKLKNRTHVLFDFDQTILDKLGDTFTKNDYLNTSESVFSTFDKKSRDILEGILDTNYDVMTHSDADLSERIIFPIAKQELNGMEDVRFVEFIENGQSTYIGTYTAYDGHRICPQLIITNDFRQFKIRTMYGKGVNDKGFALFPEKINGQFVMLGRQGGEQITIMYSDNLFVWESFEPLMLPEFSWEMIQLGNCGSPIKTEEGWLVITHGVGAMRKYVISAILLDLTNPSKIIKKLSTPLIAPNETEREGYVPNVVYSCGSMKHGNLLVIPYAKSDSASTFGTVDIGELLDEMVVCKN